MKELPKAYEASHYEDDIYRQWESGGFFQPQGKGDPFCVIMPPPNANGSLHLGHALYCIQDIMTRYHRMKGDKTLYLPGADHAGFETQVVYDKKLEKEGRKRSEIPREQLWQEIWDFTQSNKELMERQLRKLGMSCDWSREKFTLDSDIIKIVYATFKRLYDDGLVYRGDRSVNWCTKHQTTLSDLEVKHVEQKDPLYYIKYGPVTLATVRLETKFGDTAVAVNPKDKRYKHLVGKSIDIQTLLGPAQIKVIADDYVDPKFGTGAVKVTPAHDPNDFEMWQRHKDEIPVPYPVIDQYGKMDLSRFSDNPKAVRYHGLKVEEARKLMAEDMQKEGLMEKVDENYAHSVGTCYKCGRILEPRILPQWYIAVTKKSKNGGASLRDAAVEAVKEGKVKFVPKRMEKIFMHWMKNLRDWNISRQIVWGIRIPVWYKRPQKPITISFIRHTQTEANAKGVGAGDSYTPLTEEGLDQLEQLKKHLGKDVVFVYSSDRERALQTAVALFPQSKIKTDHRLRGIDFGSLTGAPREEINKYRLIGYPKGETHQQVHDRMVEFLSDLINSHSGEHIVIVGHNGTWKALRTILRDEPMTYELLTDKAPQDAPVSFVLEEIKCIGNEVPSGDGWVQESDVFDTWFSSGQWPFATLGYPDDKDFKQFYPTSVMETGWDILLFWVTRMIMLGLYATGEVPFKHVYLHGLVRDKDRQKMSKSKGNVIDPLGVIDQYGTDALRMALVVGNTPGNDIVISEEKIKGYRNFANKVWNISRFVILNLNEGVEYGDDFKPSTSRERAIIKELKSVVTQATKNIEKFHFYQAAEDVYHYVWHTFADVIIEEQKARLEGDEREQAQKLLVYVLVQCLKLLHPFMPFVTEAVWGHLPLKDKKMLIVEEWPI